MRLLTVVLRLAVVGSAVVSRLLGTWFGCVPVETDPGYVRAMRSFGLRQWRGSAPFPVIGEHLSCPDLGRKVPDNLGTNKEVAALL